MHEHPFAAVQTTVSSEPEAEALARRIIEERLAACVQVTQVRSYYRWDGVQSSPEQLLTCKTASPAVSALKSLIAREHPYDEPELIVLPITDGSEGYLDWVSSETR